MSTGEQDRPTLARDLLEAVERTGEQLADLAQEFRPSLEHVAAIQRGQLLLLDRRPAETPSAVLQRLTLWTSLVLDPLQTLLEEASRRPKAGATDGSYLIEQDAVQKRMIHDLQTDLRRLRKRIAALDKYLTDGPAPSAN